MLEREVFATALQKPTQAERVSYLDEACAGDSSMRKRILALLQAERELGGFMESPPLVVPSGQDATQDIPAVAHHPGTVIGPYKLVEKIGEGGFGVVYLAEQTEPVRRKVALKVIKPGMDTKEVIARFEAERRALALMDHPHIARVLDCGATVTGVPYFVMELVHGIPITDYCDQNKLVTRERLALFVSVCRAVQHAHQKGVIHRDIKPSNVMISRHDGMPVPKIIDFGISKAIDRQLTETALYTEYGRLVGTPLYMSPEQASMSGLDVDTRTDVYSLGVLLYELLTGATPFEKKQLEHVAYDEIRRIIRDQEPPRPSTRISALGATATTISACRQTDPKKLSALLRHDLDWIVMKALEKDRDRRYDTAISFATDVQRYLNNEPVEAYPPSAAYKTLKFARRNQRALLTAAALIAIMLAGTVVSAWQAIRATNSERLAKVEAATSEAVLAFINRDLLAPADPFAEPNRDLKVREALDRASENIKDRFPNQPLVAAAIHHTVGTAYLTLGEYKQAERHLLRAVEIRRRQLGAEHRHTLASTMHLAITTCDQGRHAEAEQLHEQLLQVHRRVLGPEHPSTLGSMMNLIAAIYAQGRYAEAETLTRELLDLQDRVLGAEHPGTLKSVMNLASIKRVRKQHAEAEQDCRRLLQIQRRVLRPEHPDLLENKSILANAVMDQNRHAEAELLHREVYDARCRVLGPEHPTTLNSMNSLALTIFNQVRYVEAEELRRQLLESQQRILGKEHPATLQSMMNLANIMNARGNFAQAEELHRNVLETRQRILGSEHPDTLMSFFNLSHAISNQGRLAEAEQGYRTLLELQIRLAGPEHPDTLKTMMNLSVAIHKQRRFADAEKLRRAILATQIRVLGPEHPDTLAGMMNLANSIKAQRRYTEAEQSYREVFEKMRRKLGEEHQITLRCMMALAAVVNTQGRHAEAEEWYRRVLEIQHRALGAEHPDTLQSTNALAWFLAYSAPPQQRNPAEAVELAKKLLSQQPDDLRYVKTLAQAQYRAGNLAEAMQALRTSLEANGPNCHDLLTLALVHWELDEKDQALTLYDRLDEHGLNCRQYRKLRAEFESRIGSHVTALPTVSVE